MNGGTDDIDSELGFQSISSSSRKATGQRSLPNIPTSTIDRAANQPRSQNRFQVATLQICLGGNCSGDYWNTEDPYIPALSSQ